MTAPARRSPAASLLEYFTLARATAAGVELGATRRKQVADALAVGRQRGESAETLWSNGHSADGLRLAFESLDETLLAATALAAAARGATAAPGAPSPAAPPSASTTDAAKAEEVGEPAAELDAAAPEASKDAGDPSAPDPADEAATVDGSPEPAAEVAGAAQPKKHESANEAWREVLTARGVRPAALTRLAQALEAVHATALPALDADVSPALSDLFPQVMASRQVIDDAVAPAAWSTSQIVMTRVRRATGVALALVATVIAAYFGLHEPEGTFYAASDVWQSAPTFAAEMAFDGRPETIWLLSDRTTGWLEFRTSPGRRVERVILTNATNAPTLDRATSDYRLEIYANGEFARAIDGHFDWSDQPTPVTHEIGLDGVNRIRFVVVGYHRNGGGLAEMHVE